MVSLYPHSLSPNPRHPLTFRNLSHPVTYRHKLSPPTLIITSTTPRKKDKMGFYWSMPVHRSPLWIENTINNGIQSVQAHLPSGTATLLQGPWSSHLNLFSLGFVTGSVLTSLSILSSRTHHHEIAQPDSSDSLARSASQASNKGDTVPQTPVRQHINSATAVSTPTSQLSSQRCFSDLAHTAPVTYATLRRNGVLNKDGTPTKGPKGGVGGRG